MLRYERYKTSEQNNPTSTDEVLLEMAGGQGTVQLEINMKNKIRENISELMGATAIEPTTVASEYGDAATLIN